MRCTCARRARHLCGEARAVADEQLQRGGSDEIDDEPATKVPVRDHAMIRYDPVALRICVRRQEGDEQIQDEERGAHLSHMYTNRSGLTWSCVAREALRGVSDILCFDLSGPHFVDGLHRVVVARDVERQVGGRYD